MNSARNEIQAGQWLTAFFRVISVKRQKSRNGRDYHVFELLRCNTPIRGYLWSPFIQSRVIKPGSSISLTGFVKELNGIKIIEIRNIRPADETDVDNTDIAYFNPHMGRKAADDKQLSLWPANNI